MLALVADDDASLRRFMGKICARLGWEVQTCVSGEELAAAALRLRPGLIISDFHMQGTDGLQACMRIRSELPGAAFVIMTGDRLAGAAVRARGFSAVLNKPFTVAEAVRLITSVTR
jgi:CheY-like chemotaxis protein